MASGGDCCLGLFGWSVDRKVDWLVGQVSAVMVVVKPLLSSAGDGRLAFAGLKLPGQKLERRINRYQFDW
jgi:ABC-type long-subunit fatty acid transport system fused permease/ATPase subunit